MTPQEARARYEAGESMTSLAVQANMPGGDMRRILERAGTKIRTLSEAHQLSLDRPLHTPPAPKLCTYGCRRPATSWQSQTCLPCALCPPCTCGRRAVPARMYMGQWMDRICELLIQGGR